MAYKLNEKKYRVIFVKKLTFSDLQNDFQEVYDEMCDYHEKKITDYKHYMNFVKKRHSYELSTADAKEIIRMNTEPKQDSTIDNM